MNPFQSIKPKLSRMIARSTETVLPAGSVAKIRAARDWRQWADALSVEALSDQSDAPVEVKRALFRRFVRLVEIETHARCNRVCWFCPNSLVDRRRNKIATDVEMLDRIFTELGSIDYSRQIKVARYSEPLTNPHLAERIASARRLVPRAELAVVTNTDYLTREVLDRLRDAGLDTLHMSIYLRDSETWSLNLAHEYKRRLAKKLGVKVTDEAETPVSLRCRYEYAGVTLRSACIDFTHHGTDRGGVITHYATESRVGPCREPFETFVVDYTGAVQPCCNLRSDVPEQAGYTVADLSDPNVSIFDVYAGALANWRRSMADFAPKSAPCTTCRHRELPPAIAPALRRRVERRLRRLAVTADVR